MYEGVREAGEFEPVLLSRSGPPISIGTRYHEGRPITLVNHDPHQYFFYTDMSDWDWVFGRSPKKPALTRFFREFLLEQKPDIVHFQHTMYMGYDILRVTRNTLPDVPIVYTLHEYLPICHHNGQMVRTMDGSLCDHDSPRRCHECFPRIPQQTFFMRKRFIQSQMSVVDLFVTPSAGALEQYVRWGIPRERIVHEPHGFVPAQPLPERGGERDRDRFGFFGQFTEFKGADVLLEAFASLTKRYARSTTRTSRGGCGSTARTSTRRRRSSRTGSGSCSRMPATGCGWSASTTAADIAKLMARVDWVVIPSIWWETGPLTVGEAFQHGRPVICSDMGGMSEKVTDGVNGLYFRRGDADELADVIERAATTPGLWEELRRGIPAVPTMREHVASLSSHYRRLLASRAPAPPRATRRREQPSACPRHDRMSPTPDSTPDGTLATRLAGGALLVACPAGTEPAGALPVGRCADGRALAPAELRATRAPLRRSRRRRSAGCCWGRLPAGERNRLSDALARRCDGAALSRSLHELREGLRERLPQYARAGGDPRGLVLDSVLALGRALLLPRGMGRRPRGGDRAPRGRVAGRRARRPGGACASAFRSPTCRLISASSTPPRRRVPGSCASSSWRGRVTWTAGGSSRWRTPTANAWRRPRPRSSGTGPPPASACWPIRPASACPTTS